MIVIFTIILAIILATLILRQYRRRLIDQRMLAQALEDAEPGKQLVVNLWHHHHQDPLLFGFLSELERRGGELLWHTHHHELGPSVPRHRLAFVVNGA